MYSSHTVSSATCFGNTTVPSSGSLRSCYNTVTLSNGPLYDCD